MKYGEYIFIKSNKYFISKDYLQSLKFIDYEKKLIIKIYKWNPYIHHQNIFLHDSLHLRLLYVN